MNNQDFDKLITVQKEEIERIKNSNPEINIREFYLNKYHEMYQEILEERMEEINEELRNLENEIHSLNDSVDRINEDIENNERIQEKITDCEDRIHACYCEIEEKRFQTETVLDNLQTKTIKLFKEHQEITRGWIETLYSFYERLIDKDALINAIYDLTNIISTKGYELAVKIKENEQQNTAINNALNDELQSVRQKLDALFLEKSRYEKNIYEVSVERREQLKKDLALKQEHKKCYKEEIEKAFIHQSNKNLKEMNELLIKFSLTSKDPNEQIELLDKLCEKFRVQLISLDTLSNQEYQKKKRLSMLYEEKSKFETLKNKKSDIDKKAQTLQSAYLVISKNVKDLDEHLEDIKKQILSVKHQQFLRFEEQFQKELSEGLSEIKKQQQVIEEYQEERTYLLYEANSDKVKEVDIQIHNEDLKLNKLISNYDSVKKDYDAFLQQNDNAHIKELIEEGRFFETKLPQLKQLTLKLKDKVNSLNEESQKIQEGLEEYQNILMQIQELENED